jgi:hypothetical protein
VKSQVVQNEIAAIPHANCWCTHSCWIQSSTKFSPRVQLFHIPWAYLKHRWNRLPAIGAQELEQFRVTDAPQLN